jgi:uncharacterized protein (TIGR00369 family)
MSDDPPAAILLGREILAIDAEREEIRLRYIARPEFANRHGTIQGGFLSAMLDSATGLALVAVLPDHVTAVTTRLDVSFLKPASIGPLLATARVLARDDRSATAEAQLTATNGAVLATAEAALRLLSRRRPT